MGRLPLIGMLALLGVGPVVADGLSLRVQNDFFTGTDHGYSDGTELLWSWHPAETNTAVIRSALGVRNRMYTPDSISEHPLQLGERPYCATLSTFYQCWRREGDERVEYEVEAGVLGPHAYGEQLQHGAHRAIHDTLPQGWSAQLGPDEPILNLSMERWHPLAEQGAAHGWQTRLHGVWGGAGGTTFVHGEAGGCLQAGWNMPADTAGGMVLENPSGEWFVFAFAAPMGRLVLHNATLGASLFHDRENERALCPVVGELEFGVTAGWGGFTCTYSIVGCTREFVHQQQSQDYGNIQVDYTWKF